ncbi:MAG: TonB-dependent receptor plug domain-containing protein [Flavobacterium sp.]|nr:TonB-dependent receptor plug domain-containing protein [Flavobacterium sp.]
MYKKNSFLLGIILLICSYGFSQDTLKTIQLKANQKSLTKSLTNPLNTQVMTSKELLKAACCNLAESFETNPSIDVNFSDALTGTKQIKMLGLTSPYLVITTENIPSVRGASQIYGLSFIPGTWVESIQITKGAGSVVNGFESISGQINAELLKPLNAEQFFLNAYGSSDARFELNAHVGVKLNPKWSSVLLLHGNTRITRTDMNADGFMDNPLGKQLNVLNRYQYYNPETGWVSFLSMQLLQDQKISGQMSFNPLTDGLGIQHWGANIKSERADFSSKVGYVFKDRPYQSIGFQNAFSTHQQQSYFGLRTYDINHKSYYSNLVFSSIIRNTMHKFTTGLTGTYDDYQEYFEGTPYLKSMFDAGAYFEYTYDNADNFSVILGGRVDQHSMMGTFVTPRFHLRYNPWKFGVLRLSAGEGRRMAAVFAENQNLMASSRSFVIENAGGSWYGLNPERARNYGLSFLQKFRIGIKNAEIGFDLYRTDFLNQVVVDLYQGPQQVEFFNLKGVSFANSFQLDFNIEPLHQLYFRTAYKYYDIQTDYRWERKEKPLQAKHRLFENIAYETLPKAQGQFWKFDFTLNWLGVQQLPYTVSNAGIDQFPTESAPYTLANVQCTRIFGKQVEVYAGVENATNYQQPKAILGAPDPFGTNFDASIVYAPIFGRMFYGGLRYKLD